VTSSTFRKNFTGFSRADRGGPLATRPAIMEFDVGKLGHAAADGWSFVGVRFTGCLPRKESAIDVNVQDQRIPFSFDSPLVVLLLPGCYSVSIYRSGALKAGTLDLAPGELVMLNFHFSRVGITFSGWVPPAVVSVASLATEHSLWGGPR